MRLRFWRRVEPAEITAARERLAQPYPLSEGPGAQLATAPVLAVPLLTHPLSARDVRVMTVHYMGSDRLTVRGFVKDEPVEAHGWASALLYHVGPYGGKPQHPPRVADNAERLAYYAALLREVWERRTPLQLFPE